MGTSLEMGQGPSMLKSHPDNLRAGVLHLTRQKSCGGQHESVGSTRFPKATSNKPMSSPPRRDRDPLLGELSPV